MLRYGTTDGYKAYELARGRAVTAEDPEIEAAGLVASEALDGGWRASFPGLKTGGRDQVRAWPRTGVVDSDGYSRAGDTVPVEVENATYELMRRELASPGSLLIDYKPGKYKSATVQGAVSVVFADVNDASEVQSQFPIVGQILAPLLTGRYSFAGLSGAVSRI